MKFPSSEKGLRMIFYAMVTFLIAIGAIFVEYVYGFVIMGVFNSYRGVSSVITWAWEIAWIVAAILFIVGVVICSKYDSAFKSALYTILCTIIAIFALWFIYSYCVPPSSRYRFWFCFFIILVTGNFSLCIFVVKGIKNLANKLQDKSMESEGKYLITLFIWTASVTVAALLGGMVGNFSLFVVSVIAAYVGLVMHIVTFFMFFGFIKKGEKMLANAHD